jgi:anti-anti-sigma factor
MNGSRLRALATWHANGAVTDSLTEAHAADLRDWLVDLVEVSHVGVLELDLSEVEHIDDAGLEVLVSVSNLLAGRGQALLLREVSPSITQAVYGAGLHRALHTGEISRRSSTVTGRPPRVLRRRQQSRASRSGPRWISAAT